MVKYFIAVALFLFVFASPAFAIDLSISNAVVSNDEVTVQVAVSALASNSCPLTKCYLQGMFTKTASPAHYFGFTKNNYGEGDWYKYFWSPSKEEIQSTYFYFIPENRAWSGTLNIKNDPADPDYVGPGDYFLRVRRYTGNSDNGPTSEESNDLTIGLTYVLPTPTPEATSTPTPAPTNTPTPTPTKTSTPNPTPTKSPTPKSTVTASAVAGESAEELILGIQNENSTPQASPEEEVTNGKKFPVFPVILIISGLVCIGGAVSAFFKNAKSN